MFWISIVIFFIMIVGWISLDMRLGKNAHDKNIPPYKEPPIKTGDALFFSEGNKFFMHLFHYIDKAEDHIHIQFYIFREDQIGTFMLQKLMEKARQGISVRLMIDWVGSRISKKMKKKLRNAGVKFKTSHRPKFPFIFFSLNVRNHRKVTVIDGKYGYIGGFNVGDEYLGRHKRFGKWRDYHLFLTGEIVADLQSQFIHDWNDSVGEKIESVNSNYFPPLESGMLDIQIHPTKGAHVKEKLLVMMEQAKESILIGSPYFIPGKEMINHLIRFGKKGIQITLLIPKFPDHPLVKDAAYPYFRKLLDAGIEVRQYKDGFYHSKIVVIDSTIIDVGTANFDLRSFYLNYEMNCIVYDKEWITQVKKLVYRDFFDRSEQMTWKDVDDRTVLERGKEALASVISPIL